MNAFTPINGKKQSSVFDNCVNNVTQKKSGEGSGIFRKSQMHTINIQTKKKVSHLDESDIHR